MNPNRRLTIALVFLALAVGLFLIVQFVDFGGSEEEPEDLLAEQPAPLFPGSEFSGVSYARIVDNESGTAFAVTLNEEEFTWEVEESPPPAEGEEEGETEVELVPDAPRIGSALMQLPSLRPSRVLNQVEALSVYGLGDDARYTIEFTTTEGESYTLYIGATNPAGTSYYVQIPGSEEVYLVSRFALDELIGFLEVPPFTEPTPTPSPEPTPEGE